VTCIILQIVKLRCRLQT